MGEKRTQICTRISEEMFIEVKHHCVDNKITITDFVKNAIIKELEVKQ